MATRSPSAYQMVLFQLVFGLALLLLMVYGLRSLMFGGKMAIGVIAGTIAYVATVLALDDKYWLFPVFCFGFRFGFPYIKFTGYELGALVLVPTFFVRQALHRDDAVSGNKALVWAAIPFLAWMCLVWGMHPTGMFIFGSSKLGGRFYFKVILAFLSLVCLSSMKFGEKDAKRAVIAFLCGHLAYTTLRVATFQAPDAEEGLASTHYKFAYLGYVAAWFLARYSAPSLLSRFWPLTGFLLTFGLTTYSGNRHMFGLVCLIGIMAPVVFRRERVKTAAMVLLAAMAMGIMVTGHGRIWHLPYSVQRSLSFLPGKWDRRLEQFGFHDMFRAELRHLAKQHIRENPWFGDGGFSLDLTDMVWYDSENSRSGSNIAAMAYGRNWHNVWYGMAADFGIPLSVAWAFFMALLILHGRGAAAKFTPGSWSETAAGYFYLLVLAEFANFFFNGGHSAKTPEMLFVFSGLLLAVENGVADMSRWRQIPMRKAGLIASTPLVLDRKGLPAR